MPKTGVRRTRELRIRIGGAAGEGIKAAGQTLARTFADAGLETCDLTEYPSLIRGGHNTYLLRVSESPIYSHVSAVDVLVALDAASVALHAGEVEDGGAIVFDPADFPPHEQPAFEGRLAVAVPLGELARESGGVIMRNTVALGAVLALAGFPLEPLLASLRAQFASKPPEIAERNVAAARLGHDRVSAAGLTLPFTVSPVADAPGRLLVDGNEAIGLGALAAGIGLYAAYPMTPASSLLHFMAAHEQDCGIVVKHTEDEIAAMNMVVGAAFTGTRAMCATSGGGFALMNEALGLAGVSESAVVVGVMTRPGPATGMPTWTEQSDLRYVIHAAQGEFPRVVLAPGDQAQCFELAWRAFDLADQLQTPVILLGDSYLSDNRRTVPRFDLDAVTVDRGRLVTEGDAAEHPEALGEDGAYLRYKHAEDGVSVRIVPGVPGALQLVNSYEHDEHGYGQSGEIAAVRVSQHEKRMRKLELARRLVPPPRTWGPPSAEADIAVLCWGSTFGPAREAAAMLADDGVSVAIMQVVTLWPFPAKDIAAFLRAAKRTTIIEGDLTGQLEGLVREQCLIGIEDALHRYDGRPFSPERIAEHIREVLHHA